MDEFRKKWFSVMGWMSFPKCECCNWTVGKCRNKKQKRRIINKNVRAKLKEDLRRQVASTQVE